MVLHQIQKGGNHMNRQYPFSRNTVNRQNDHNRNKCEQNGCNQNNCNQNDGHQNHGSGEKVNNKSEQLIKEDVGIFLLGGD
jgi:hypothetical protein